MDASSHDWVLARNILLINNDKVLYVCDSFPFRRPRLAPWTIARGSDREWTELLFWVKFHITLQTTKIAPSHASTRTDVQSRS